MSEERPQTPETGSGPKIGADEWVARSGQRIVRRGGVAGAIERRFVAVPVAVRLGAVVVLAAIFPLITSEDNVRVGFDTLLLVLLAMGLNVVVGWGGLLDLGYYAFYGFGGYAYAWIASSQFTHGGIHLPTIVAVPAVVIATALLGLLVGLPSRRLVGDYLAIVTLFFGQIFTVLVTNGQDIFGINFTNGSNGISAIDPFNLYGKDGPNLPSTVVRGYYWVALGLVLAVLLILHRVHRSRTGRAWRSLREDELAAETMGVPVNWLKLMAFSFGAAVAGLAGTVFAALNVGVFPQNFSVPQLITVYAIVILGGSGSLTGVVIGAVLVNFLLDRLQYADWARGIFYGLIILGLIVVLRPRRRAALVLGGTLAFGFAIWGIVHAISPATTGGPADGSAGFSTVVSHWVVVPPNLSGDAKGFIYVALIGALLGLTVLRGRLRDIALVPALYLAALAWENVMSLKTQPTRFILLGAILISMMVFRPEGLLGKKRVEII